MALRYEKYIIKKASTSNIGWSGFSLGELPFNIPCRPAEASGWWKVLHLSVTKIETTKLRTNSGLAVLEASCKSSRPPSKLHRYTSQLESTSGKALMGDGKIKNSLSSSSTRSWRLGVVLVDQFLQKFHIPIPSVSMQMGAKLFLLNAPLEGNEFLFCTHLTSCWKTARTQRLEPLHHCCTETSWLACEPDCARAVPLAELLACHSSFFNHFTRVLTYDFLGWKWQLTECNCVLFVRPGRGCLAFPERKKTTKHLQISSCHMPGKSVVPVSPAWHRSDSDMVMCLWLSNDLMTQCLAWAWCKSWTFISKMRTMPLSCTDDPSRVKHITLCHHAEIITNTFEPYWQRSKFSP